MKLSDLVQLCENQNMNFSKVTPETEAAVKKLYSKLKSIGIDFRNRRMEDDIYIEQAYNDKTKADITFAGQNWDVYTARAGEEDDDHPNTNSKFKPLVQKAEAAAKEVFKGSEIRTQGGEKYSIYVSVRLPINKIFKNELKLESLNESMKFSELVKQYGLKTLPRYFDAKNIKRYGMFDDKKKLVFDIDVDGKEYRVDSEHWKGPSKTFNDVDSLAKYLATKNLKLKHKERSDAEIIKWIGNQLGENFKEADIKKIAYIDWGNKVQIVERSSDDTQLPYMIFVDGDRQGDESSGVGKIDMTIKDFKAWLDKHAVPKRKKPERRSTGSYYD